MVTRYWKISCSVQSTCEILIMKFGDSVVHFNDQVHSCCIYDTENGASSTISFKITVQSDHRLIHLNCTLILFVLYHSLNYVFIEELAYTSARLVYSTYLAA